MKRTPNCSMTLPDGTITHHYVGELITAPTYRGGPDVVLTAIEQLDVFQRACSQYNTLAHIAMTLR